jgi:hypothetical protein
MFNLNLFTSITVKIYLAVTRIFKNLTVKTLKKKNITNINKTVLFYFQSDSRPYGAGKTEIDLLNL